MADPQQRLTSLLDQADTLLSKQADSPAVPQLTISRQWRGRWLHKAVQRWLQDEADLDDSAKTALAALPELLGYTALRGEQPWSAFDVPARQLAELAVNALRGLDRFSGRRSEALPSKIAELLTAATRDPDAALRGCQQLGELLRQHASDIRPAEQQLIQRERAQRQQLQAQQGVSRLLQSHLGDHALPEFALPFFDTALRKLLQITHVQSGDSSAVWQQLTVAIDTLVWALNETTEAADLRTGYSNRLQPAVQLLQDQFGSIQHDADTVSGFFDALDFHVLSKMSGKTPTVSVTPWPISNEESNAWTRTGNPLLKARALRVGDWVQLQVDDHRVRARLIDKDLQFGSYLFANLSGLRVARLSVDALAEQFENGLVRIIDARPLFVVALPLLIEELENRVLQLQLDALQVAAQQRQQEAARLQAELELVRAAEARAREQADADREARALADAEARLLVECQQACRRLQPGAWIELRQGPVQDHAQGQGEISAQLAVIINRTGELLFVDRQGRKLLQVDNDTLAGMLARAELRIRDYGRALDDALQQLVADNRQKLEEWRQ